MTERNASSYIRSRGIKGGEITLVKQLAKEGKSDIEIDFALLNYQSNEVSNYLNRNALAGAQFKEIIAKAIDADLEKGTNLPPRMREASKKLHREANFIKRGLKKIFPNL